ncbi:MAG: VOC family protein [Lysobacteraceae bacterium]|nr:MAG: VOC family protein [Xanthomonadaceae bacterium]
MTILNALAGIAVKDIDVAVDWYEQILGPATRPMDEVAEWQLPKGGCLQVFEDGSRAGLSSVTLVVEDLDREIAGLESKGIRIDETSHSELIDLAIVQDQDGNQVVFAHAKGKRLAS